MAKYSLWDMSSLTNTDMIHEHIIVLFSFTPGRTGPDTHGYQKGKALKKGVCVGGFGLLHFVLGNKNVQLLPA